MQLFKKTPEHSLPFIGFVQSVLLTMYCGFVAALMFNGNRWFGKVDTPLAPVLFLLLFISSALISVFIVFWYPFQLFWYKKQTEDAVKLILYTTGWLVLFVILIIFMLLSR